MARMSKKEKQAQELLRHQEEHNARMKAAQERAAAIVQEHDSEVRTYTHVLINTMMRMLSLVQIHYTPRDRNRFNIRPVLGGYQFGLRIEDDRVNRVELRAIVDFSAVGQDDDSPAFRLSHSTCGEVEIHDAGEFASMLTDMVTIGRLLTAECAAVKDLYGLAHRGSYDPEGVDTMQVLLSEAARRAKPVITAYMDTCR